MNLILQASEAKLSAELEKEQRAHSLAEQTIATLEAAVEASKTQAAEAVRAVAESAQAQAVQTAFSNYPSIS
eukprot:COSAG05_NODE_416_length_10031_cov_18.951067_15_plen_72_part_00